MRLTHLPLNVQSLGHKFSTISDISGGISGSSSLLSLTYEDMFLPIISPHSFISNVTAERANEVSPVSWNIKKIHVVHSYQQLSQAQKTVTPEIFHECWLSCDLSEKKISRKHASRPYEAPKILQWLFGSVPISQDCLSLVTVLFVRWLYPDLRIFIYAAKSSACFAIDRDSRRRYAITENSRSNWELK